MGVFLRFAPQHRRNKIYDPATQKCRVSRDIQFYELVFPFNDQSSISQPSVPCFVPPSHNSILPHSESDTFVSSNPVSSTPSHITVSENVPAILVSSPQIDEPISANELLLSSIPSPMHRFQCQSTLLLILLNLNLLTLFHQFLLLILLLFILDHLK